MPSWSSSPRPSAPRHALPDLQLVLFGSGLALLIAGAVASFVARTWLLEAVEQVEQTHQILAIVEELRENISDAAAMFRLGGRGPGARPRPSKRRALGDAQRELDILETLTREDASQQARLRKIRPVLDRMQALEQKEAGGELLVELLYEAHQWLGEIADRERRLLAGKSAESMQRNARLNQIVVATGFLAILLLAAAIVRLRREDAARQQAQRIAESILETAPNAIVSLDGEGTILRANRAVEKIFGYRPEELLGRNVTMIMPPWSREEHEGQLAGTLVGESTFLDPGMELDGLHRDGHLVAIHLAVGKSSEEGNPRFIGMITDISDRRRAEEVLAETLSRLQGVLDGATDVAIIATDLDGRVTLFSRGAERMLGYSASEVMGDEMVVRFHLRTEVADRGQALSLELGRPVQGIAVLVEKASRGEPDERTWTYVHKDGSMIPVILVLTPLYDARPLLCGFLAVALDISGQKQAERLKDEFVSIVSHELRTPLTSIKASLELLTGGLAGPIPPKAASLIEIAHRNAERLILLVNDILDIRKIEAGEVRFSLGAVDVREIVAQAVEANLAYASQLGVRIVVHDAGRPARVRVDLARMVQVLTNLFSNAAKYSPEGDAIEVSTTVTAGHVAIDVKDHGPGIPEEFHPRLFQKFAQADGTDNRRRGGTGLGLAIAKAIVEKHGGRLTFETAPGRGTTFRVEIPLPDDSVGPETGELAEAIGQNSGPTADDPGSGAARPGKEGTA